MTLPASGTIGLRAVGTELGRAVSLAVSLNETAVRSLAAVPSGAISLKNLYGKSQGGSMLGSMSFSTANWTTMEESWEQTVCRVSINGNITIHDTAIGSVLYTTPWADAVVGGGAYEVMFAIISSSGSVINNASTWTPLATVLELKATANAPTVAANSTISFTVQIRKAGTTTPVLTSPTLTITARASPPPG